MELRLGLRVHMMRRNSDMYMVIVTGKVAVIILWSIMSVFVSCVYEGPDRVYRLDSNYQMWGWPGWIMRYDPVHAAYTRNLLPEHFDSRPGEGL